MREQGFTLMEIMVVLVVTGMLMAAGLPALNRYRKTLVERQAREQLIQDLRFARQQSVTRHTPVVVSFPRVGGVVPQYLMHQDLNNDRVVQTSEMVTTRKLPRGTTLTSSLAPTDSLIFDLNGVLWPGTSGGSMVIAGGPKLDTLLVSAAGMVYRQ